jgi:hypothetical protein
LSFGDFSFTLLLSTSPSQESVEKKEKPPRSRIRWDTCRGGLKINQLLPSDPD